MLVAFNPALKRIFEQLEFISNPSQFGLVIHFGKAVMRVSPALRPLCQIIFDSTSKAAVSASALSLRCSSRSSSLTRRRSCRASAALAARGSPRPAIAPRFQASSSAGYKPCSRH